MHTHTNTQTNINTDSMSLIAHQKAAKVCGISGRTLTRWVAAGTFASPININGRKYYRILDLNDFLSGKQNEK